jgi:hypothetical protein
MADNAYDYIKSLCHDCKNEKMVHETGTNDLVVVCRIYGTLKPAHQCGGFKKRKD